MELYWELGYTTSFGGSYNILFRNTKYNVCQETIINLDKDGNPESEEIIYYFDGEHEEFKTEDELITEIKRRGFEQRRNTMSATKDFLMEVEEARDYLKHEFPETPITIGNNGVILTVKKVEYSINPIPRDDYPKSRRMNGWKVIKYINDKSEEVGEMVPSYEQAAKLLANEMRR